MGRSSHFRQRVVHREVKTHYTISEMLECGHRHESLMLLADSLTARHRVCEKCASTAQKKPSASILPHNLWPRKVSGG